MTLLCEELADGSERLELECIKSTGRIEVVNREGKYEKR
jgi:hypothetical protein